MATACWGNRPRLYQFFFWVSEFGDPYSRDGSSSRSNLSSYKPLPQFMGSGYWLDASRL